MSKKRIVICFSENGLVDTIIPSDLNVGKIIKALESNLNEVRMAANKKIHDIKCNEFSERVKNGIMGVPKEKTFDDFVYKDLQVDDVRYGILFEKAQSTADAFNELLELYDYIETDVLEHYISLGLSLNVIYNNTSARFEVCEKSILKNMKKVK
jgi:uncharacterized protein (UPF0210 family)